MIPIWEGNPVPGSSQYQGDLIMDPNVGTRQERKDLPTTLIMTGVLMAKKIRDRQIMAGRITCPDRHHRDYQMAEKICCRGRPLAIDTEWLITFCIFFFLFRLQNWFFLFLRSFRRCSDSGSIYFDLRRAGDSGATTLLPSLSTRELFKVWLFDLQTMEVLDRRSRSKQPDVTILEGLMEWVSTVRCTVTPESK
jgi:hypothetical protein